jgi:deoxyribonuclease IV
MSRRPKPDHLKSRPDDLLGAHVSVAGGLPTAPPRARAIGATVMQIFTTSPNQWRERQVTAAEAEHFRDAVSAAGLRVIVSHDSYLINLATPNGDLRARSILAFRGELERATLLGLDAVVSHPGNYLDDRSVGLARNAAAYTECLRAVPGPVMIWIETTVGTGTALGASFEELRALRDEIGEDVRDRVAFCADTCHLHSSQYDLVTTFDPVWTRWDQILGLDTLRCLHLNDSKTPSGSRRDRHELIGEGTLGPEPFRRIMTDPRFAKIPKIIETPKGDDVIGTDRRMLRRLRRYARSRR